MRPHLLAILLAASALPATAGETAWHDVAPGVKLRLISTGQIKPDGTTLLGLEIDMPETSKTYWRVPGDTGLPTELDFAGSTGVTSHDVVWPYPTRQETDGYLDYVYFGPTVLPIELTLDAAKAQAEVAVTLGICSDICVPAQARFSLDLAGTAPDRANGLRIRQALAMAPIMWAGDPQPIGDVDYDVATRMIEVHVIDPDVDPASLIAATASGQPLFGTPQKSPEPNLVLIPVLDKGDEMNWANQDVQLTFTTGMGAFIVARPVTVRASD